LVLIRAVRDSNIPKFVKDDLPLFNAIVRDLFPGIELQEASYDMLINAVKVVQEEDCLTYDNLQTEKIIQFYETMNVRFGLMIIGQTLTGKSTVYKTLRRAMNQIRKDGYTGDDYMGVDLKCMNPKSISMDELYGAFS
jgi:dynein heavy chain